MRLVETDKKTDITKKTTDISKMKPYIANLFI